VDIVPPLTDGKNKIKSRQLDDSTPISSYLNPQVHKADLSYSVKLCDLA
jgi:hypothetical protein